MVRVSVVIPAYNALPSVADAIASVQAQTERRLEILVVDDASTDGTAERVAAIAVDEPRLRLLRAPVNAGPGTARNQGFAAARGEWVALLDADDRFHPERLERLMALGDAHGADMVADNLFLCSQDGAGARVAMIPPEMLGSVAVLDPESFVDGNMGGASRQRLGYGYLKPLIRRSFLDASGIRYDPARFSEDYVFSLRLLIAGARWVITPEPMYDYAVAENSLTDSHSADDLARLLKAERGLLSDPAVVANPALGVSIARHARSVELALAWFRFAKALKRHDPVAALAGTHGNPAHLAHIGRQAFRALPHALRKLATRRAATGRSLRVV